MKPFSHRSVLLREVVESLVRGPGGNFLDGTVGGGGHAAAILEASSPSGFLKGCDRDEWALTAAGERLAGYAGRWELRQGEFAALPEWVEPGWADGATMDLGVSSPQLDEAERGFSFMHDGPLDMRMDQRQGLTAADIVNGWDAEGLANLFWGLGGERESRRVARALEAARSAGGIQTTLHLAEVVARAKGGRGGAKTHPATQVFQALRIEVNDELGELRRGLEGVWNLLKPGGRLAVITFHSLEDRVMKEFGRRLEREYESPGGVDVPELRIPKEPEARWLSRKAILPGEVELRENPRARSAQLRVLEKLNK